MKHVIVEFEPGELRGHLLTNARVVRSAWCAAPGLSISSIESAGPSLDQALNTLVASLRPQGRCAATLLYAGGGNSSFITMLALSKDDAEAAAALAARESLPEEASVASAVAVASGELDGRDGQCVVSAAAPEALCDDARAWFARCGLDLRGAAPISAVAFADALARQGTGEAHVAISIGRHATVVQQRRGGKVAFARGIEIGTDRVRSAYLDALTGAGLDERAAAARANELYTELGLCRADAELADAPNGRVSGRDVLLLLQPAVQRLAVELRQTLRVAKVPATEVIRVGGEGAALPGLVEALAAATQLDLVAEPPEAEATPWRWLLSRAGGRLRLEPASLVERRRKNLMLRCTIAGVIAAGAVLAGEGMLAGRADYELREDLRALAIDRAQAQSDALDRERALEAAQRFEVKRGLTMQALAGRTPWSHALSAVAESAVDTVRVEEVSMRLAGSTPRLTITGSADASQRGEESALMRFVTDLQASKLFYNITVVGKRLDERSMPPQEYFEVLARPISLPPDIAMGFAREVEQ